MQSIKKTRTAPTIRGGMQLQICLKRIVVYYTHDIYYTLIWHEKIWPEIPEQVQKEIVVVIVIYV